MTTTSPNERHRIGLASVALHSKVAKKEPTAFLTLPREVRQTILALSFPTTKQTPPPDPRPPQEHNLTTVGRLHTKLELIVEILEQLDDIDYS